MNPVLYDLRAALDDEVGRKLASHRLSLGSERPALFKTGSSSNALPRRVAGWGMQVCVYARQSASCSSASPRSTG
jgi:hypothetical protein